MKRIHAKIIINLGVWLGSKAGRDNVLQASD